MVYLSYSDLFLSSLFLFAAGLLAYDMRLGIIKSLSIATLRMVIQLLTLGMILKTIFSFVNIWLFCLMSAVMFCAAGFEVVGRQRGKLNKTETFLIGTGTMGTVVFIFSVLTLSFIIGKKPWYTPQYAIPLIGIILGNTMNGITVGLNNLTMAVSQQKKIIETRLMLGHSANEAVSDIRKNSIKSGMIPLINSMSASGIVTLPGMMTGQIMAGAPPVEAVKYQILIMFLIGACTAIGTILAVNITSKRFFDSRQRLRLERLE